MHRYESFPAGWRALAQELLEFPSWAAESRAALQSDRWVPSQLPVAGARVHLSLSTQEISRPEVADNGDHYRVVEVTARVGWYSGDATATEAASAAAAILLVATLVESLESNGWLRFSYLESTAAQRAAEEAQVQPKRVTTNLLALLPAVVKNWRVGKAEFSNHPDLVQAMEKLAEFSVELNGRSYLLQLQASSRFTGYVIRRTR